MQPGRELKQSLGVRAMAAHLGVSPTRVRQLIGEGRLPATQVSGRWVLDARSRFGQPLRRPGRPLEPRNAWGLLLLAEGRLPEWLDRFERSRLRARLRGDPLIEDIAAWCRRRAELHRFMGHPSVLDRVRQLPGAVVTGASAQGHDILDLRMIEVYLRAASLRATVRTLALEPAGPEANVLIRVPSAGLWPFDVGEAGPATVAVDLWEAGDSRSQRAADALLQRLLREARFEPGWSDAS
jgi:hypothetical protein